MHRYDFMARKDHQKVISIWQNTLNKVDKLIFRNCKTWLVSIYLRFTSYFINSGYVFAAFISRITSDQDVNIVNITKR